MGKKFKIDGKEKRKLKKFMKELSDRVQECNENGKHIGPIVEYPLSHTIRYKCSYCNSVVRGEKPKLTLSKRQEIYYRRCNEPIR